MKSEHVISLRSFKIFVGVLAVVATLLQLLQDRRELVKATVTTNVKTSSYNIANTTKKRVTVPADVTKKNVDVADGDHERIDGLQHVSGGNAVESKTWFSTRTKSNSPLPVPLQVLEEYKSLHSVESLINHTDEHNQKTRSFSIVYYSCPFQAGNRLHHFFNGLLWAIVTNRTALWKYYDRESCEELGTDFDPGICKAANNVTDCDQVLQRSSWLPSYDEWKSRLSLDDDGPPPKVLDFWATHPKAMIDLPMRNIGQWLARNFTPSHLTGIRKHRWQSDGSSENMAGIDDPANEHGGSDHQKVVVTPIMLGRYQDLADPGHRAQLLRTDEARERARRLYALGPNFLYGMLFRHTLSLRSSVTSSLATTMESRKVIIDEGQEGDITTPPYPRGEFSLAVHSRHKRESDTGSYIDPITTCLETLLESRPSVTTTTATTATTARTRNASSVVTTKSDCVVYIMTDRFATISALQRWLSTSNTIALQYGCRGVVAHYHGHRPTRGEDSTRPFQNSTTITSIPVTNSFKKEHGPFAGRAFFEDLEMSSLARNGVVGHHRSSSELLIELIDYDRHIEHWKRRTNTSETDTVIKDETETGSLDELPVCFLPR